MNNADFASVLTKAQASLDAWAGFVVARIQELVRHDIGDGRFEVFFKIPPKHRLKTVASALRKQEKKNYADPMSDMTDLVGARFVVLLRTDIDIVERALSATSAWTYSRDRHFAFEQLDDPEYFDYQSVHYILRAAGDQTVNGVQVPDGIACEVQIRTLLQHAYAELVHDNIYKPAAFVPQSAKRLVARCMALMETSDDIFCQAMHELKQATGSVEELARLARDRYGALLGAAPQAHNTRETLEIIETYRDLLEQCNWEELDKFLGKGYGNQIRARAAQGAGGLFADPAVVVVYWLANTADRELVSRWPIPAMQRDLDTALADLGKSGGGIR